MLGWEISSRFQATWDLYKLSSLVHFTFIHTLSIICHTSWSLHWHMSCTSECKSNKGIYKSYVDCKLSFIIHHYYYSQPLQNKDQNKYTTLLSFTTVTWWLTEAVHVKTVYLWSCAICVYHIATRLTIFCWGEEPCHSFQKCWKWTD